jgi:hypothetical protein
LVSLPGLAAAFERIRDAPRVAEEAFASRNEALSRTLTALGFPVPAPGQVQEYDGFVYLRDEGEECDFTIGRFLGGLVPRHPTVGANIPGSLEKGGMKLRYEVDLFWFVHQEGEWRQHSNHVHYYVPPRIAERLAERHTDRSRAYFYAFSSVRLRDADWWKPSTLEDFISRARGAVEEFRRGELVSPGL